MGAILVRSPGKLFFDALPKRQSKNQVRHPSLPPKLRLGPIARFGKESGHDDRDLFGRSLMEIAVWRRAEVMDDVALLPLIPPPQELHVHADAPQGRSRLLDLNLEPAMSEREGRRMIK